MYYNSTTTRQWQPTLALLIQTMFSKKKHTECKPSESSLGVRKHQKHARKPTKDKSVHFAQPEVLAKYRKSSRENAESAILQRINAIFTPSTGPALDFDEAVACSDDKERLVSYFWLAGRRQGGGGPFIEQEIVKLIQAKHPVDFTSRPVMHYGGAVCQTMWKHLNKKQNYLAKITAQPETQRAKSVWRKELPTLIADKQATKQRLNTSQSFELNELTQCIKQMFSKLAQYHNIGDGPCKGSWFDQEKEVKPLIDFDCSSIIGGNKPVDLPIESTFKRVKKEVDLTYGLDQIRKKYENFSPLKASAETMASQKSKSKLVGGSHKRTPTQTLPRKGVYQLYATDAPGSAQNLPVTSPKSRKKTKSKQNKDEPYQLHFFGKKKKGLKQNNPKDLKDPKQSRQSGKQVRSKMKTTRTSKSKSRQKGLRSIKVNLSPH